MAEKKTAQQLTDDAKQYSESWSQTMINIWREKILRYNAINTGSLIASLSRTPVVGEGSMLTISHQFVQYGFYVDKGVGRGYKGNSGALLDDGLVVRKKKPWFDAKYYSSKMNLKDTLSGIMGEKFVAMVSENYLDGAK